MSVLADNFSLLLDYRKRLAKLTRGLLREAALFSEPDLPAPEEIGSIYEEICGNTVSSGFLSDLAVFCMAVSEVYQNRMDDAFRDSDSDSSGDPPKIAYLQNTFSDRAYRVFADDHMRLNPRSQVTAAYFPGFREVCEEVYYGRCSHAMLPVSSSRDGSLPSFRKLISKYELKIVSETDVDMGDDSVMRFALLRRGLNGASGRQYADLSVVLTEDITLGAFLTACESLGTSAVTINSYPLEYADDRWGTHLTLDISHADPNALYLFLESSHISYEVVGLYHLLSSQKSVQNHSTI